MTKLREIEQPIFYKKKARRPLSKKQKNLLFITLEKYLFKKRVLKKNCEKILEIGFGYGENLIHLSKKNNRKLFVGCEIYEPGIANLVEKIEVEKLKNIYLYTKNIFLLFKELRKNSIDKVFILYPDPWPKKKHFKRKIISKLFIKKLNYILKKNAIICISTDSQDYLEVILFEFISNKNFLWVDKNISNCLKRPKDLIPSKYEKKANVKKNKKYYLKFKKIC